MHEAQFYIKGADLKVECQLCPFYCVLNEGQTGNCKVRVNKNGKLFTLVYNKIAALGIDPIEKKPLYHFYPGKNILSIGEVGCNLHCSFCQNHHISQCMASDFSGFLEITSEKIIEKAIKTPKNIGIAYTYNEPFIFYEFMLNTAKSARNSGLKNVVVSNGYINPEPLKKLLPYIDALNIDLKSFNDDFYRRETKGKLAPVLETLKTITESQTHLEITNLVIPGLNDDENEFTKMVEWISTELGADVPLHLSRYFPQHKMNLPPTTLQKMLGLYEIAGRYLRYVFLGNVNDEIHASTYCYRCKNPMIIRSRYKTSVTGLNQNNGCQYCGTKINIVN
jgi:pyruvate formate lyase activating enzyme